MTRLAAARSRREVAARPSAGIDAGLGFGRLEWRQVAHQVFAQRRLPFGIGEVQRLRLQRFIRRRLDGLLIRRRVAELLACFVVIRNQFQPRRLGFLRLMPQQHQAPRQIIEQRVEAFVEQRQPMFHARRLAARADGFIKRIVACRAEGGDIAGAEAADRRRAERRFAGGQQLDAAHTVSSDNCVSASKRRIASSVSPKKSSRRDGLRLARRETALQIDDAAAQTELAGLAYCAGAHIAVAGQEGDQRLAVHLRADLGGRSWPPRSSPAAARALQQRH